MANVYGILRLTTRIKSRRLKLFGIWLFHVLGKRYSGIFLDPVFACNFRCKMCYFSDAEKRKTYRGTLSYEDIELIAAALFHRALKLQIGCGAEPALHKDLTRIIALGKHYKVPYISLTTNGSLLTKEQLKEMVAAGLDEITISAHGLTKETYESLMTNGNFNRFKESLGIISDIKKQYSLFRVRINYTINKDNLDELKYFWDIIGDDINVLQLRPIQKIGESEYTDFDLSDIYTKYDTVLTPLIEACRRKNITCIVPEKENIAALENNEEADQSIVEATYCYVSPRGCWKDGFDYKTDTFESFSKREHLGRQLLCNVFGRNQPEKASVTRKMNYNIK
ncbi:Molybdenum cofactor biosynthesis protein A [Bacteroidales bacterium Barb4]|nr:Molybdenum cofactor biosynthesis protein A [Bacteroidales bacterium Barb4]